VQYALQRRSDEKKTKTPPDGVRAVVGFLAGTGVASLLDHAEPAWREQLARRGPKGDLERALVVYARRQVEDLACGTGWDVEYGRDVWRLRTLGVDGPHARLRFDRIPQPWLKDLAKRYARWRLGGGLSGAQACWDAAVVTRFAVFLAAPGVHVESLAQVDRTLLERYLAHLRAELAGSSGHGRHVTLLGGFFQAIRRHGWDDSLPATAVFFAEDHPKQPHRLPRALAEHVMAQVEDPANLDRWDDPGRRLATVILMRCGLRVSDALGLPRDCLAFDADGAPYLRYYNHKMKREALVPIDGELHQMIIVHQRWAAERWPGGTPVLFPRSHANLDGTRPVISSTYRNALYRWLQRCDIRDEHGQPVHLTPHQWRHIVSA
jgi:integrase